LPCVAEVWNYGSYSVCSCSSGGVGEEQKFDEMGIYLRTGRLNNIDIAAAHAFQDFHMLFTVRKLLMARLRQGFAQHGCHRFGQTRIG
jgi:hypothetical protein